MSRLFKPGISLSICLLVAFVVISTSAQSAAAQTERFRGEFGGEGGGLYYGGLSIPSIILYSVLASMVVAVAYTSLVISRNEIKRRSQKTSSKYRG